MIPSVHARGSQVAGLLRYLFGPGRREEHDQPRLVAAWVGAPDLPTLHPPAGPTGRLGLRRLTELLEQPLRAALRAPERPVWHCSVRNHPTDPILGDGVWADIAAGVMAGAGLAPPDDDQAVRWVAVRHALDHIHLVATLVRQDRRTEPASNDWRRVQAVARTLEIRYRLRRVGAVDPAAAGRPRSRPAVESAQAAEKSRDRQRARARYTSLAGRSGAAGRHR